MIVCSGRPKVTSCPMHLPTALRHNEPVGFMTGLKSGQVASCDTFRAEQI